ncbi:putative F-box/FBD/LRR-repeat protein [Cardamine amara subsp. amara]|uniref:F-box/FBD/LRR-repeat protein n=1 Tax=Cardamine amara subsp. amara TaxID=228776 RepID=A0ABD1BJQ1_CARAN
MPKLVEANVEVNLSTNGKLMKVLTSAEYLSLDLYPSTVFNLADRFISKRLLHLNDLFLGFWIDLIQWVYVSQIHPYYNDYKDQPCSVSEPNSVPECLCFHLETLQWIGYTGTHEEMEAMVYVLKNARSLKNATISLHSTVKENDMMMMMMIKELESMSKGSPLCQLFINF